jgi:hypothetical protein
VLPKVLDIAVAGADQIQIFRALMCLYPASSAFWAIAAFKPDWQRAAVACAVFFCFSLSAFHSPLESWSASPSTVRRPRCLISISA